MVFLLHWYLRLLPALWGMLGCVPLVGQQLTAEAAAALEQSLASRREDTTKAHMLCQLTTFYNLSNPSRAIWYGQKALAIARKEQHLKLTSRAMNLLGISYGFVGSYELAATYFYQALRLREPLGNKDLTSAILSNIGVLHSRQNQFRQALALYNRADSLLRNAPELAENRSIILSNISEIYNRLLLPDSAILYARKGYALNPLVTDPGIRFTPYIREARAWYLKQDYVRSLQIYRYAETGLGETIEETDRNTLYRGMSDIFLAQKDFPQALLYARKAHASAIASTSKAELQTALEQLARVNSAMGNDQAALTYTVEGNSLKESLNSQQVMLHLQTLETHFDLTAKQRENKRLQEANRRQSILIATSLVMLALALALLAMLYRVNQQRKQAIGEISQINRALEHAVDERTRELTRRNDQLISYAYLNSHQVRGPLARLMGLVYLLRQGWWGGSPEELVELIDASATELDSIIREINESLSHGQTGSHNPPS